MDNISALRDLMQSCVEMGYIRGQVAMMPSSDMIRKKDAEALLMRNGFQKSILSRWVGQGLVVESKGEKNSPIRYSLMQIMETISAIKCRKVFESD